VVARGLWGGCKPLPQMNYLRPLAAHGEAQQGAELPAHLALPSTWLEACRHRADRLPLSRGAAAGALGECVRHQKGRRGAEAAALLLHLRR